MSFKKRTKKPRTGGPEGHGKPEARLKNKKGKPHHKRTKQPWPTLHRIVSALDIKGGLRKALSSCQVVEGETRDSRPTRPEATTSQPKQELEAPGPHKSRRSPSPGVEELGILGFVLLRTSSMRPSLKVGRCGKNIRKIICSF